MKYFRQPQKPNNENYEKPEYAFEPQSEDIFVSAKPPNHDFEIRHGNPKPMPEVPEMPKLEAEKVPEYPMPALEREMRRDPEVKTENENTYYEYGQPESNPVYASVGMQNKMHRVNLNRLTDGMQTLQPYGGDDNRQYENRYNIGFSETGMRYTDNGETVHDGRDLSIRANDNSAPVSKTSRPETQGAVSFAPPNMPYNDSSMPHHETPMPYPMPHHETPMPYPMPHHETPMPYPMPRHETSMPHAMPHHETPMPYPMPHHETPMPHAMPHHDMPMPNRHYPGIPPVMPPRSVILMNEIISDLYELEALYTYLRASSNMRNTYSAYTQLIETKYADISKLEKVFSDYTGRMPLKRQSKAYTTEYCAGVRQAQLYQSSVAEKLYILDRMIDSGYISRELESVLRGELQSLQTVNSLLC